MALLSYQVLLTHDVASFAHKFAAQDGVLHTGTYKYDLLKALPFRNQVLATSGISL